MPRLQSLTLRFTCDESTHEGKKGFWSLRHCASRLYGWLCWRRSDGSTLEMLAISSRMVEMLDTIFNGEKTVYTPDSRELEMDNTIKSFPEWRDMVSCVKVYDELDIVVT